MSRFAIWKAPSDGPWDKDSLLKLPVQRPSCAPQQPAYTEFTTRLEPTNTSMTLLGAVSDMTAAQPSGLGR
jgi:hypothetical protein